MCPVFRTHGKLSRSAVLQARIQNTHPGANDLQTKLGILRGSGNGDSGKTLLPRAQQSPYEHEFAQVIGVVIGNEERFAEDGLAVAVGNFCEQVG